VNVITTKNRKLINFSAKKKNNNNTVMSELQKWVSYVKKDTFG